MCEVCSSMFMDYLAHLRNINRINWEEEGKLWKLYTQPHYCRMRYEKTGYVYGEGACSPP